MKKFIIRYNFLAKIFFLIGALFGLSISLISFKIVLSSIFEIAVNILFIYYFINLLQEKIIINSDGVSHYSRKETSFSWEHFTAIEIYNEKILFISGLDIEMILYNAKHLTLEYEQAKAFITATAEDKNIKCTIHTEKDLLPEVFNDKSKPKKLRNPQTLLLIYLIYNILSFILLPMATYQLINNSATLFPTMTEDKLQFIKKVLYPVSAASITASLIGIPALILFIKKAKKAIFAVKLFQWIYFSIFLICSNVLINILSIDISLISMIIRYLFYFFISLGIHFYLSFSPEIKDEFIY